MLKKIQNIIITIVILLSIPIITMGVASIYSDGANLKTIATQFHIDGIVGINNTGPDRKLDILDATNPQLRLTHTDGSVYTDLQTDSSGFLTINSSGNIVRLNEMLELAPGSDVYRFDDRGHHLVLQNQNAGEFSGLEFYAKDGDGTDDVTFQFWGVGTPTSVVNREKIELGWDTSESEYFIMTEADGSGTLRPIDIYTEGNQGQLYIAIDGNIGIATTTPYHALQVDGAIQCDGFWGDMAHLEVYSTTTQTIAVVNTAQEVIFEGIADEHGDWNIDTGVSTSTVYIPNTGTYLATYEFQPSQSTGGTNVFEFAAFLAGTELLASTQQRTLSGTSDIGDSDRTIHFEADAGDAFLIKMAGDDTAIQISATSSVFTTASSYNLIIHQLDGE